ncbi:MAG: beta-aspartyl-peptidase [Chloroflexi bacterium]|nr:beta-aspartyl-peptidase [Chloroflexota bacterium]
MITLLAGAEVYAPEALGRRDLLLAAGQILWIGARAPELPAALLAERIELDGLRLMPGLIDAHAHLTGGGGEAGYGSKVPPMRAGDFLRSGVTSVVGVLGTDDCTRSTAELVSAARGFEAAGISAWCHSGGYHVPPVTLTGSLRGDIVHVDRIIGAGEVAISDHRSSQPTLDELLRLASEAHVAGLMTGKAGILHLHVGDGPRGLELVRRALETCEIPARVFNPTHVNRRKALFDEALDLAGRGCWIDLTAFPVAEDEDAWAAEIALARYLESGHPPERITISSDGGGCLPVFDAEGRVARYDVGQPSALATCLKALLDRGWPLERVLPAFTRNVAQLLRLPGKGRLAAGADADLLTLDAQGRVHDVWARGRRWLGAGQAIRQGPYDP